MALVDVVGEGSVLRVGQILHVEELLRLGDAPGAVSMAVLAFSSTM